MRKDEALNRYKKHKAYKYIKDYQDADAYCVVHEDDRHLIPIYIPLPEPPEWHLIDGFGLPAEEQMFKRVYMPKKLRGIQYNANTIEDVWDEIEQRPYNHKDSVEWIKKQVYHELNGYWFFCHGKPTYITGDNYVYCMFWHLIDTGYPEYRNRDRKWYLFNEYIRGLPNFCGFNSPKHRRAGDTSRASQINYFTANKKIDALTGIQSKTEPDAKKVYSKHIIKPWKKLPFIFKPLHDSTDNPKGGLSFVPPANIASKDSETGKKGSILSRSVGLESEIGFRSSDEQSYDGDKLHFHHGDESGKTTEANVYDRHGVIKECLQQGAGRYIFGHCINTSTVEEMEGKGGRNFKDLCDASQFHDQYDSDVGKTKTWMATLFIPAYDGLEGFVDQYGQSIIESPTDEQYEYMLSQAKDGGIGMQRIGAKEYLEGLDKQYVESGDTENLLKLRRKYPSKYAHCWTTSNSDTGMPHEIIEDRLAELSLIKARKGNKLVFTGDFIPADQTDPKSPIIFVENDNGKFEVSKLLDYKDTNKYIIKDGMYLPGNMGFGIAGGDPFGFNRTKNRRMSNGGGAVFMYRTIFDRDGVDVLDWEGNRFVCTYNRRPASKDEYCQDMLNMCRYYGILINVEQNKPDLMDYFEDAGYGGFLKRMVNKKTGKFEVNPGTFMGDAAKQKVWTRLRDHLKLHGHREMHADILEECRDIEGIEKMVDFDVFTASGLCLIGMDEDIYEQSIEEEYKEFDIKDFFC
jgi:hypothetical protein